jgi:signal transduction histidine kinase
VKFTEKGEVEHEGFIYPLKPGRGRYTFYVRDTGIGITKAQTRQIVQSFYTGRQFHYRKYGVVPAWV